MNNKVNTNEQLARMKVLMGYGLQTESKKTPYSSIENQKLAADGKIYAIIREGAKYYIKSAPNKQNLVKEDFNYIGGFRNRKDNEYTSFANAQKQFDLKMMSLKEAANKSDFNISSWDLDKKENVVIEATDKMRKEILRERQIMKNATMISEKKGKDCANGVCCDEVDDRFKKTQENNIKVEKPTEECGDPTKAAGYTDAASNLPKEMTAEGVVKETSEKVLGWNRNDKDYMDKSHGTEIGDSAPFDDATARNIDDGDKKVTKTGEMKNGVVENHGTSMHDTDDQNKPAVGVGEGPSDDNNKPFDDKKGRQIDEAIDDLGEEPIGDDDAMGDDFGGEEPMDDGMGEGEPMDADAMGDDLGGEEPMDDGMSDDEFGDEEVEDDDVYEDDLESRVAAMEDLLNQIAEKLGVGPDTVDDAEYGDDELFDDEEGDDFGAEDNFEDDEPMGDDFGAEGDFGAEDDFEGDEFEDDDEMPMENRRRNGVQIYETKAYRRAMRKQRMNEEGMTPFKDAGRVPQGNMNKLDDFGKHPAYQKKVMTLPPKDLQEFPDYYDMNDDSVKNDMPYGEKIGDGAPFDIDPQSIDNAIAEAFDRLKKKRNK